MNQETFLKELERLLSDVPEDERREALEYYRCYFEDAGVENEESVLAELVSPEQVAQTIKADLQGDTVNGGFTENGYEEFTEKNVPGTKEQIEVEKQQGKDRADSRAHRQYGDGQHHEERGQYNGDYRQHHEERRQYHGERRRYHEERGERSGSVVGKAFAIFGIGIGMLAVVIALAAAAFGLITATVVVGGTGIGLVGAAAGLFIAGMPATALVLLGGGFVCLAIFFLLLLAAVAVCGKAFPAAIRGICNAAGNILYGRERTR